YYLRARAVDNAGNTSNWTTVLTYKFDNTAPVLTHTAETEGWTNVADRGAYTWTPAGSSHGLAGYNVYWGTDSSGTSTTTFQADNSYDPPTLTSSGVYYLCVQAKDEIGNVSEWITVLTYKFDNAAPVLTHTAITEGWTNVADRDAYTWTAATDSGSGVAGYYVYWGTNSNGTSTTFQAGNSYDPPALTSFGKYYLRVLAKDNIGNVSSVWTTVLEYRYTTEYFSPEGSLQINGGANYIDGVTYTSSDEIILNLSWGGVVPVIEMWITGGQNYNRWLPIAADHLLTLMTITGEGLKTVTVKYRNEIERESPVYSASVFYDVTKPNFINPKSVSAKSESVTASFSWSPAEDNAANGSAGSGVDFYNVYWGTNRYGESISGTTSNTRYTEMPCPATGVYYLRAQPVDKAGNIGEWATLLTYDYTYTEPKPGTQPNDNDPSQPETPADYQTGNGGTNETIWSFPNPFSPAGGDQARIVYTVEEDGPVKVFIYNLRGVKVWQQENTAYAGRENQIIWDGSDLRGRSAANGTYIMLLLDENKKVLAKGRLLLLD
ncbi:hypothetical protein NO1_1485, partial [Candidatus Termititenax aidoneus]